MREILFRGKRLSNGEWVYGFIIKTFGTYYIIDKDDDKNIAYKIIPETDGCGGITIDIKETGRVAD